jgi:hypothetical protein
MRKKISLSGPPAPQLRLFVWVGFCPDYTDGLAVAVAETEEQAKALVIEDQGYNPADWGNMKVYPLSSPIAFSVSGGG